jgi:hypothetical protein
VIVSRRPGCLVGLGTAIGIVAGCAVMIFSFGPAITILFLRPRWRAGLRYDALDSGEADIGLVTSGLLAPADFPALLAGDPTRTTLMLDWSPSEFSRLRLQYAWDEARDDGDTDRQLQLQYLFGIGAHGAHKY